MNKSSIIRVLAVSLLTLQGCASTGKENTLAPRANSSNEYSLKEAGTGTGAVQSTAQTQRIESESDVLRIINENLRTSTIHSVTSKQCTNKFVKEELKVRDIELGDEQKLWIAYVKGDLNWPFGAGLDPKNPQDLKILKPAGMTVVLNADNSEIVWAAGEIVQ